MIKTPEEGREIYKDAVRIHRKTIAEQESRLQRSDYSSGGFKAPVTLRAHLHEQMRTTSKEKLRYMALALALTATETAQVERELDAEEKVALEEPYGFCG
jgi:hypothetical protein